MLRFNYRDIKTPEDLSAAAFTYFDQKLGQCRSDCDDPVCVYRRNDGHTCVAGAFIPDDLYNLTLEDKPVAVLAEIFRYSDFGTWLETHMTHLQKLQEIHDDVASNGYWEDSGLSELGLEMLASASAAALGV